MKNKTRIIFMGTPDFSVPALRNLAAQDDFEIPLVITQPDRPKGRGKKMSLSSVKQAALELGLDLYQPASLKDAASVEKLSDLSPDFYVVAAFGQILSPQILQIPSKYPINIHASLLPKYRGASPIQASILNMDDTTGITTMVMAEKMDAGDILLQESTPIHPEDTAQTLHDRLGSIGASLIVTTIRQILAQKLTPSQQDHAKATYVKLLKKEDGRINWQNESRRIIAHVNAMTPWPSAFSKLGDRNVKIFSTALSDHQHDLEPGTVIACSKDGIHVATGDGAIVILELQGSSGKHLTADQYLRGHDLKPLVKFNA